MTENATDEGYTPGMMRLRPFDESQIVLLGPVRDNGRSTLIGVVSYHSKEEAVRGPADARRIAALWNNAAVRGLHTADIERGIGDTPRDPASPYGELYIDAAGNPHFICHTTGEDFPRTKEALQKFIGLLQRQLDNEESCPYYVEGAKKEAVGVEEKEEVPWVR